MLKKCWKSDLLLASLVSLAFLLASGSNALQSLERKAYDGGAVNVAHRDAEGKITTIAIDDQQSIANTVFFLEPQIHPSLAYINQITGVIAQPNILNLVPELAQLNTVTLKAQTSLNIDTQLATIIRSTNNVVLAMPFAVRYYNQIYPSVALQIAAQVSADIKLIETLTHSVASILNEDLYVSPSWAIWVESSAWLLVALYLILLFPYLKPRTALLITIGFSSALVITHQVSITQKGWWLQLMMPCALLLIGHVLLATKRQLNKAETVFGQMSNFDPKCKKLAQRITCSKQMSETVVFGRYNGRSNECSLIQGNQGIEKTILGCYQIEKELGKGAMGVVYLGRDPKIGRVVAIKTMAGLSNDIDADELTEVKARFFREAETAGRLNHPNIVTIYDAGAEHGLAYIAMEFLQGEDLAPYTQADNLLTTQQVIDIVIKVASALDYAHTNHVVHRDIKPSNIMVEMDTGVVKVTDFGIARTTNASKTKTGIVLGTPSYMSPELLLGKEIDGRSDLFSLGVTLYSLLTGELPFSAESMAALMYKIANESHVDIRQLNPEFSEDLAMTVNKMLEKNVENRYQTGDEIANALKRCVVKVARYECRTCH
ncbi:MAG: serine/threonine-protein kinase [Pseudomonadota bacterium]